jgi:hypothetical protein
MSYIGEPFKYDIFVSYSHGDVDSTGISKLQLWSQAFARELEAELKMHPKFNRSIAVFVDSHERPSQGVDPMVALTDQLRANVGQSALLTVLMSPHYIRSKWCDDERDWWCTNQIRLGLRLDGRIAVARIWPTTELWPQALIDQRGEELVGFPFYDKTRVELRPQPYEWPEPRTNSTGPFREALLDLVGWLGLKLEETKTRVDERRCLEEQTARLAAVSGQVVYLHGRAEQVKVWEQTGSALANSGFVVMPTEPDPVDQDLSRLHEIRRRRVETLSGCDALLLLGTQDGRALDADLVVVGRQDRHSARALSNRPLPCALLDSIGSCTTTSKRRSTARGLQVDWIDATQEPWAPEVKRWLVETSARIEAIR